VHKQVFPLLLLLLLLLWQDALVCLVSLIKKGHGRRAHGLSCFQAMGIFSMAFLEFFMILLQPCGGNRNSIANPY